MDHAMFDAHLHITDPDFPLVENNGYLPRAFTVEDYRTRVADLTVVGGGSGVGIIPGI